MSIALGIIISTVFSENYILIPTDSMDQKIGALLIPFHNFIHYQHIVKTKYSQPNSGHQTYLYICE